MCYYVAGAPDLHAGDAGEHLPEVIEVPLRERLPVPAHQPGGGAAQTQRLPQVLRQVLPRGGLQGRQI